MNASEINSFGIIINKLSKENYDGLGKNSLELKVVENT